MELVELGTNRGDQPGPFGIDQNTKRPCHAQLQSGGKLTSQGVVENTNGTRCFQRPAEP